MAVIAAAAGTFALAKQPRLRNICLLLLALCCVAGIWIVIDHVSAERAKAVQAERQAEEERAKEKKGRDQAARDSENAGAISSEEKRYLVFVTNNTHDGNLGGTEGAAEFCRAAARNENLPNAENYRAWISTPESNAADEFLSPGGPWYLVNRTTLVAKTLEELTSGKLSHAIDLTEHRKTADDVTVWTQTESHGNYWTSDKAVNSATTGCKGFTSNSDDYAAFAGLTQSNMNPPSFWTLYYHVESPNRQGPLCSGKNRLYCFEQRRK